jgi:hypothetical protein
MAIVLSQVQPHHMTFPKTNVGLTCKLGFDEPLQDLTMSSLHDEFLSMTHNSLPGQGYVLHQCTTSV